MALLPSYEFLLRLILGLWIMGAGCLKFADLYGFIRVFKANALFPRWLAGRLGFSYAFLEVLIGLALLLNTLVYGALVALVLKQVVSMSGIIVLLIKKVKLPNCGCYGVMFPVPLSWWRLVDNILIVIIAMLLLTS